MPNLDKTGPEGKGPKTGQGKGRCADNKITPSSENRPLGRRNAGRGPSQSGNAGQGLKRNRNA